MLYEVITILVPREPQNDIRLFTAYFKKQLFYRFNHRRQKETGGKLIQENEQQFAIGFKNFPDFKNRPDPMVNAGHRFGSVRLGEQAPEVSVLLDGIVYYVITSYSIHYTKLYDHRGVLFEGPSGWGKSSLVLASVARLEKMAHFAVASYNFV